MRRVLRSPRGFWGAKFRARLEQKRGLPPCSDARPVGRWCGICTIPSASETRRPALAVVSQRWCVSWSWSRGVCECAYGSLYAALNSARPRTTGIRGALFAGHHRRGFNCAAAAAARWPRLGLVKRANRNSCATIQMRDATEPARKHVPPAALLCATLECNPPSRAACCEETTGSYSPACRG